MSSKLLPGDTARTVERVPWRQVAAVQPGVPAPPAPAPARAPEDELRRECERRVAEARAAGRARAAAELQPVLQRLGAAIDEIASLRPRLRREAEADTIQLAVAIARRVIRRELTVDPDALHGIVLGALDRLQSAESCRVRVHPSQAAAVSALIESRAGGAAVEVIADASRAPGGVVVESDRGDLDASVDTQLGEIERGLADVLRRQS